MMIALWLVPLGLVVVAVWAGWPWLARLYQHRRPKGGAHRG